MTRAVARSTQLKIDARAESHQREMRTITGSLSWRLTAPLRRLKAFQRTRAAGPRSSIRSARTRRCRIRTWPSPGLGVSVEGPHVLHRVAAFSPGPTSRLIEVRDLERPFLPDRRVDTLKERVARPLRRVQYRELRAVRGISFDVHQGEFFGIVGRNGSGKSTLLKVLASIYRADAGRIRMAGRLAPFIELGVGINPELTARENVELNGVMMGLGRRDARKRLDSVLEFAELQEFVDLKLKNYSSGMLVRLAFSVMVEADADVMLVDEVLAVGDAAFAQKCMDVFHEKKDAGKTLILVTHDMATVQAFCDRAMLIHDGEQRFLGDPEEAALGYYRLNFAGYRRAEADSTTQGRSRT